MASSISTAYDSAPAPVRVEGKFFWAGDAKLFIRGVTYGPFAPDALGSPYPDRAGIARDFARMASAGINTVRTFTAPPQHLIDAAASAGLRILAGLAWQHHTDFGDAALRRTIKEDIAASVRSCGQHPSILAYLVGNEIAPDMVRWQGAERVAGFIGELAAIVRREHPGALVSYASYPSTEYLTLPSIDFVCFNLYLHEVDAFRRYLGRLHNIAGERPLVVSELGMDTLREGEEAQAALMSLELRAAFDCGVAGVCVFAWTDEWFTGGRPIEDWRFGLLTAARDAKPALAAVTEVYGAVLPPPLEAVPRVSVVVCAYNAERTLGACLASLAALAYADYEVIVVDDGSGDGTRVIAESFSYCRLLSQPNLGLSAARNAGARAATGEIVAYTDSDCVADPHWLHFLVRQFETKGYVAVGGPNLAPAEDSLVPAAVAVSPGGPTHVLLTDTVAEHIAGCNMAIRRDILLGIGGFDPLFRTAGDDVDLCWRLQDAGYTIGYAPAAMVWHFRRNSVAAYFAQQRGYGRAEALVWRKHPARFNLWGQARWSGRIYGGLGSGLARRSVIYSGPFGRAAFQTLYTRPDHLFSYLPLTFEWQAGAWTLGGLALVGFAATRDPRWLAAAAPLLLTLARAADRAWRAPIEPRFRDTKARLLVCYLIIVAPLLRGWARSRMRLADEGPHMAIDNTVAATFDWRRLGLCATFCSEERVEKEAVLERLRAMLAADHVAVVQEPGWRAFDLEVPNGPWNLFRILVCTEHHGGPVLLHHARVTICPSPLARLFTGLDALLLATLLFANEWPGLLLLVGVSLTLALVVQIRTLCLARYLLGRLEQAAHGAGLSSALPRRRGGRFWRRQAA